MGAMLNTSQQVAVEHRAGRLLITAGAGSGKTRTLAERFAHAVAASRVEHLDRGAERILTITFTDKAAGELAERVRGALRERGLPDEARAVDSAWISTIHGFCTRVLRREAIAAGLDPGFVMLDESRGARIASEAFEHAVEAHSRTDAAGVQRLFDTYGFVPVRAAVHDLSRYLRARGLEPSSVERAHDADVFEVRDEARSLFAEFAAAFLPHVDKLGSAASHHGACESVLECLGGLEVCAGDPSDLAEEIWLALASYGATMHRAKATAETVELLKTRKADLLGRCARIMTLPLEESLLHLTSAFVETHREAKSRLGVLDFDDLIVLARGLLLENPDVQAEYRRRFALTMVDEFQDTDALQLALIEAVAGENLATVGDTRQSIYSFRGADVAVYRRHREEMTASGARSVELDCNYRSHADIITFVNRIFAADVLFGPRDKQLVPARCEPDVARLRPGVPRIDLTVVDRSGAGAKETLAEEARTVAERLAALRDGGLSPAEMVVLVREYKVAPAFADALEEAGLRTMIVGGNRFFGLPEVAALRALCRVMGDPHDDEALATLLMSDLSGLDDDDLSALGFESDGTRRRGSLWHALIRLHGAEEAREGAGGRILTCIKNARARAATVGLAAALLEAMDEAALERVLMSRGAEGRLAWANAIKFVRKAAAFERAGGSGPLAFADALEAEEDSRQRESPDVAAGLVDGAVAIMSIHAAKGLEFPVVAVPMLGAPVRRSSPGFWRVGELGGREHLALQLPASMAPRSDASVARTPLFEELDLRALDNATAETKRLLYVACTRAEEALVLTGSAEPAALVDGDTQTPLGWIVRAGEGPLGNAIASGHAGVVDVGGASVAVSVRAGAQEPEAVPSRDTEHSAAIREGLPPVRLWEPERSMPSIPDRVSYSDIALYRQCSLRYWAERIAGMRCIADSGRAQVLARGTALHAALSLMGADAEPPSFARACAIAAGHGVPEHEWPSIGAAVEQYANTQCAKGVAGCATVRREAPFAVRLGGADPATEGPLLVGALDVYGRTGDAALVVDYKSGTSGGASELVERYRLQAECYGLVALSDGAASVEVRFVRLEVTQEDGQLQEVRYSFRRHDAARIEDQLLDTWRRMGSTAYADLGAWDYEVCAGCPASGSICGLTPAKRDSG